MNQRAAENYLLNLEGAELNYPHGKELAVYSVNDEPFAMMEVGKQPLRISLRCEKRLAKLLIERYDEVMPGHKLNKNKWITVVISGQLNEDEITGLIYHSYLMVAGQEDGD